MNKITLAQILSGKTNTEPELALRLIDALTETITEALIKGEEVTITGFGAWSAKERRARAGINPRNPTEKIQMPAIKVAKFKTGKNLKEALKKSGINIPPPSRQTPPSPTTETTGA